MNPQSLLAVLQRPSSSQNGHLLHPNAMRASVIRVIFLILCLIGLPLHLFLDSSVIRFGCLDSLSPLLELMFPCGFSQCPLGVIDLLDDH